MDYRCSVMWRRLGASNYSMLLYAYTKLMSVCDLQSGIISGFSFCTQSLTIFRFILEHYFERVFNAYLSSRNNILDHQKFILDNDELFDLVYRLFLLSLQQNQVEAVAYLRCMPTDDALLVKIERWQERLKTKSSHTVIEIPETSTHAVTELTMDELDGFGGVKEFNAPFTQTTSKIASYLIHLPHLRIVNLAHTRFCDDGLTLLATFCELTSLDLSETRVTDKSVCNLLDMATLRRLILHSTRVSKGVTSFL